MKQEFVQRVRETILAHEMLGRGDKCVIAVSGGPDSMALLHVLWRLRDEFAWELAAAHFNHCLRGEESDADEAFVRDQAALLGLSLEVGRWRKGTEPPASGMSVEMAARRARRDYLLETMARGGARCVALGHTADDQVETVLINLLRGTGPTGLAGMRHRTEEEIIRPLLDVTRQDVLAHLEAEGIPCRTDPSNRDRSLMRNRIRHELVPYLEARFSPAIRRVLLRMSERAAQDTEALKRVGGGLLGKARLTESEKEGTIVLDADALSRWPAAEQRWAIRAACEELLGHLLGLTAVHVEQALRVCRSQAGRALVRLPNGVTVYRRGTQVTLSTEPVGAPRVGVAVGPVVLKVPGSTPIPELGIAIDAWTGSVGVGPGTNAAGERAEFDVRHLSLPLTLRTFVRGDRMRPLRLKGRTKKLKKLFQELNIPLGERVRQPVVVDAAERILWAPGLSHGFEASVTESTREVLSLTCRPLGSDGESGEA